MIEPLLLQAPPKEMQRPWFVNYGLAVVFTFLSLLLRLALTDVLAKSSALLMFYPAILASAWVGGFGAGLLSTTIAVFIGVRYFMLPAHTLSGISSPGGVGLVVFIGVGVTFSVLVESTKRAQARAGSLLLATQRVAHERSVLYDAERLAREGLEGALQRLDVLQKVTSALSEAASARQVADVLVRQIVTVGEAQIAAFYTYDVRWKRLVLQAKAAISSVEATSDSDIETGDASSPAAYVALHGEALWIESDADHEARFAGAKRELCGVPFHALAVIPLSARTVDAQLHGAQIHGVLLMAYGHARTYADDYRTLVTVLSRQATQALDRARLYEAEHRGRERASILAEVAGVVGAQLDRDATLQALGGWLVPRLGDWSAIRVPEEATIRVFTAPPHEASDVNVGRDEQEIDASAAFERILAGGPSEIHPSSSAASPAPKGLVSALVVPLVSRGRTLAALVVGSTTDGRVYDADDLHMLEQVAARAAVAAENAALFQETRAAVRYRDEFLSIASHELNTPLTPLRLQLESALRFTTENPRLRDKLTVSVKQVDRISKLVGELLDVSRITNGKLLLRTEPIDLAELVREVASGFGGELARNGCDIHLDIEGPVVASWDRLRLSQVIANLLSNAMKYGAGHPIDVELTATEVSAKLIVADRGIGIAAQDRDRIFQRYERAASARNYGGFGLGLFIAKQIIEASGGEIRFDTRDGGGTSFCVTLPRQTPPVEA